MFPTVNYYGLSRVEQTCYMFRHGSFPEVGQKQKREKKEKERRERERLNDGNNNGQLRIKNTTSGGARKAAWAKKLSSELDWSSPSKTGNTTFNYDHTPRTPPPQEKGSQHHSIVFKTMSDVGMVGIKCLKIIAKLGWYTQVQSRWLDITTIVQVQSCSCNIQSSRL